MATYVILNIIVLLVTLLALRTKRSFFNRHWFTALACLTVLTLVFDNLMIAVDLFGYNADKISGVYILLAPIEDFMYPLLAVILIPAVWKKLGAKNA